MDYKLEVETNGNETTVHWDKDPEAPSVKYGMGLQVGLFIGFVVLAAAIVVLVFFICKRRDRRLKAQKMAELDKVADFKDHLECKPWCHPDDQTRAFQKGSTITFSSVIHGSFSAPPNAATTGSNLANSSKNSTSTTDTVISMDAAETAVVDIEAVATTTTTTKRDSDTTTTMEEEDRRDTIMELPTFASSAKHRYPAPPVGRSFHSRHNGFYCAICVEGFQVGDPIYNSNNPNCQHQIHASCMDKWIEYQNVCPVCSQPFVLL
ncbi:expressed unknown protein [Seminavis robusta]|uniref:RING-type domain-containing protein n=1 Tax=Seminavis robusta TaxID=568900 RepID=A0A9N8E0P3_9STRA|nr:expressed unknown protein [Seminavis robusta]|eukprot:Sro532_g161420.1 n/a (264) ;mRNA; r:9059-9953